MALFLVHNDDNNDDDDAVRFVREMTMIMMMRVGCSAQVYRKEGTHEIKRNVHGI